ncbi:MAG: hypothetical protein ACR2JX_07130 [Mycobacteriales bacterium]
MRVGVYIDGYNLYYGARGLCGRSTSGWRWLDVKNLTADLVATRSLWNGAVIENVTYCTARISGAGNMNGQREQDVYLRALNRSGSATRISYGNYVARVATAPLATAGEGIGEDHEAGTLVSAYRVTLNAHHPASLAPGLLLPKQRGY